MKRAITGGFRPPFKRPLPAASSSSSSSSAPPPPPAPLAPPAPAPTDETPTEAGAEAASVGGEEEEEEGGGGKENAAPAAQPTMLVAPPSIRKGFIVPTKGLGAVGARPVMARPPPPPPKQSGLTETKRFDANYTKNTAKKKKVWSEGILVLEPSPGASAVVKATLENETGKVEGRKTLYNGENVGEGTELIIGQYIVEVGAPRKPGAGLGGVDTPAAASVDLLPLGDGGGSFASRFMTKGMLNPKGGGLNGGVGGGHGGAAGAAAAPLVPRVIKEGELLLYDPALEQASGSGDGAQKQQQRPPQGTRLGTRAVVLESFLGRALRPHQREGVQFLWRCLTGRGPSRSLGRGAVLADDMGLGKTLQSIALLYTLLKQSPHPGQPDVQKAIVVCPSSLLGQWSNEIKKWLHYKLPFTVVDAQLGKATGKGGASEQINTFVTSSPSVLSVLIISYETYRIQAAALNACKEVGLLVCDEAHRLKSGTDSKTLTALAASPARARILLTGTPIQNDLLEFYALVNFALPGALGQLSRFKSDYATPIAKGRDPRASQTQKEYGQRRARELMGVAKAFLLRRTAGQILRTLIPPRTDLVVFCKLTPFQRRLYEQCTRVGLSLGGSATGNAVGLRMVDVLRKLCNAPSILLPDRGDLTAETVLTDDEVAAIFVGGKGGKETDEKKPGVPRMSSSTATGGGGGGAAFYPEDDEEDEAAAAAAAADAAVRNADPNTSAKLAVLESLLSAIHAGTNERMVVVSSFTSTLDVIGALCRRHNWPALRLDGSVAIGSRTGLVTSFNSNVQAPLDAPRRPGDPFVFLLSSRAGGMGLNLVGGSRLVLFDTEWNPAVDKQVKGRIWRDGQKRPCIIYRLLSTGSIEEKMYCRQIAKNELHQTVMEDNQHEVRNFSPADLKRLFVLAPERVRCETYQMLSQGGGTGRRWADYTGPSDIQDACLRAVVAGGGLAAETVTFVHEEENVDGEGGEEEHVAAAAVAPEEAGGKRRVIAVDEEEEEESEDEWMDGCGKSEAQQQPEPEPEPEPAAATSAGLQDDGDEDEDEDEDEEEWGALLDS